MEAPDGFEEITTTAPFTAGEITGKQLWFFKFPAELNAATFGKVKITLPPAPATAVTVVASFKLAPDQDYDVVEYPVASDKADGDSALAGSNFVTALPTEETGNDLVIAPAFSRSFVVQRNVNRSSAAAPASNGDAISSGGGGSGFISQSHLIGVMQQPQRALYPVRPVGSSNAVLTRSLATGKATARSKIVKPATNAAAPAVAATPSKAAPVKAAKLQTPAKQTPAKAVAPTAAAASAAVKSEEKHTSTTKSVVKSEPPAAAEADEEAAAAAPEAEAVAESAKPKKEKKAKKSKRKADAAEEATATPAVAETEAPAAEAPAAITATDAPVKPKKAKKSKSKAKETAADT